MRVLVTGSAGFIGSHLVDCLIKERHEVWGIDDLSIGTRTNVSDKARKTFVKQDLKNKEKTYGLVEKIKPDVLFHLAAWAHEGLSQFMPTLITENNYNAYLNVLVPATRSGVKRVVCCSSMSVYGDQDPPFSESMPRRPVDIYGVAKAAMEQATEILSRVYGFEYVIVRPHNVYGPRQIMSDPYRNVVAIFINRVLMGKPFYIYGDGTQKRAFTYIDDVAPFMAKCGFQKNLDSEIINLGPRKEYTINQLANEVLRAFGKEKVKKYQPIYLKDRPLEVKNAYCTSDKAERLLGFNRATSLRVGVEHMVNWAKTIGYQKPRYLRGLELDSRHVPKTWKSKLI